MPARAKELRKVIESMGATSIKVRERRHGISVWNAPIHRTDVI